MEHEGLIYHNEERVGGTFRSPVIRFEYSADLDTVRAMLTADGWSARRTNLLNGTTVVYMYKRVDETGTGDGSATY